MHHCKDIHRLCSCISGIERLWIHPPGAFHSPEQANSISSRFLHAIFCNPLIIFMTPLWVLSSFSMLLSNWGRVFYVWPKEIITILDLLAVFSLIQARVCLVAKTDSWLTFGLLLTRTPSSFSAELNLPSLYPQMATQVLFIAAWTPSPQQRALFIFASFCTRSVQYSPSADQDDFSTTWGKKKRKGLSGW